MKAISSFILLICLSLLLQGCITATIIGTTAIIGTKTAIDPRTIGTQIDDNILAWRVKQALLKDQQIKEQTCIHVVTYRGKVLLVGKASSYDLATRAKQVVMNLNGVKKVFNEISQAQIKNITTDILSIDDWITIKVISKLLISNQVKLSNVKVITENGVVFLLGLVTKHEGKVAADIASHVNNVKQVKIAFDYLD